jgi:hypothetical protein
MEIRWGSILEEVEQMWKRHDHSDADADDDVLVFD